MSSNFESENLSSGQTQSNTGGDINNSNLIQGSVPGDNTNKLQLITIKENQIVSETDLADSYFIKINFDKSYQHPQLCMTTLDREDDCRKHPESFVDLKSLSGRFLVGDQGTSSFIQSDTASVMRTIFPLNQKEISFSFYFLSEYHTMPIHIGSLKVKNEGSKDSSSGAICASTAASEWKTFSRPGLNVSGVLSGGTVPVVVSYKFSVDASIFPRGVRLTILPSSLGHYNGRDVFISECPNDFTHPPEGNTLEKCTGGVGSYSAMDLVLTGYENIFPNNCVIKPGKTYYLNMRTKKGYWGDYLESSYQLDTDIL